MNIRKCALLLISLPYLSHATPPVPLKICDDPAKATIILANSPLSITKDGANGVILVTNTSPTIQATNIVANFQGTPLENNITQDASNCITLAPSASCELRFTPGSSTIPKTAFTIMGDNTTQVAADIEVTPGLSPVATLDMDPSPLWIDYTGHASFFLYNDSDVDATGVHADFSGSGLEPFVNIDTNQCATITSHSDCMMSFTLNTTSTPPKVIQIKGDNTPILSKQIAMNGPPQLPITVESMSTGNTLVKGSGSISVTVRNDANETAHDIHAYLTETQLNGKIIETGNTCQTLPAFGSCELTFEGAQVANYSGFFVGGSNTVHILTHASVMFHSPMGIALNPDQKKLYVTNYNDDTISSCTISSWGGYPMGCSDSGHVVKTPSSITYNKTHNKLYITSSSLNSVSACQLDDLGSISTCHDSGLSFNTPMNLAFNTTAQKAYVANIETNTISICDVDQTGELTTCVPANQIFSGPSDIALNESEGLAYVANKHNNTVSICTMDANGLLAGCHDSGKVFDKPSSISYDTLSRSLMVSGSGVQAYQSCSIDITGEMNGFCYPHPELTAPYKTVSDPEHGVLYTADFSKNAIIICQNGPSGISGCYDQFPYPA